MRNTILACVAAVMVVSATSATAASLITSKDIKDESIQNRDLRDGAFTWSKFADTTQRKIERMGASRNSAASQSPGQNGSNGSNGAQGPRGTNGSNGSNGSNGQNGAPGADGAPGAPGLDSDQPRVVTADALRGFTLAPRGDNNDSSDNGTISFDTPPTAPPLGTKALRFQSTNGKPVVVYAYAAPPSDPHRPLLAELTKASYATMIASQPQNALDVSFQFEVEGSSSTRFASGYTTVVYEPYQNKSPEAPNVWNRQSVDNGLVWSSSHTSQGSPPATCVQSKPCTFSEFVAANPRARVLTAKLKIGQNSGAGWSGFDGYVDDVSFGFGPVTRFDFGG